MKSIPIVTGTSVLLALSIWSSVCEADLMSGLAAYYPFSGNADDASVYGNNGVLYGDTVLTEDRHGNADSAYYFDGYGDYIRASTNNLPTAERTVALWFHADTLSNRPNLVGYGGYTCGRSWLMGINHWGHSAMGMTSHCNVNTIEYYYDDAPVGSWYHYAITTGPTGTCIYVNGDLKASNSVYVQNTYVTSRDLAIGVAVNTGGYAPYVDYNVGYFNGIIDEVGIWDRALSQAEIQQLMQTDLSMVPVPGAVLLGMLGLVAAGLKLRQYA